MLVINFKLVLFLFKLLRLINKFMYILSNNLEVAYGI